MISDFHGFDRKIQRTIECIKGNYERLKIPMNSVSFLEVLAEFSKEVANNPLVETYIQSIKEKEDKYRQQPNIASILQKASFYPIGKQILNQEMLKRYENCSEYFSLWLILRFNGLYDIALHESVKNKLKESGNIRDLADFEAGIKVITNILNGNMNINLASSYLPHAHRVMSGIIQFFDKQQPNSHQSKNIDETISSYSFTKQTLENNITPTVSNYSKNNTLKQIKKTVLIKEFLTEGKILLSIDGKEDLKLELFKKNKPSEQTNQIKFLFKTIKDPVSKYKLKKSLNLNDKQIERAYRSINTLINDNWSVSEYLIYDKKHSKYYINSKYPTILENL